MNGQESNQLEDPLFASLADWQRENPVRRRITSQDLSKEDGNFVTFTGRFKNNRRPDRSPHKGADDKSDRVKSTSEGETFQLLDHYGLVEIRTTRFISIAEVENVRNFYDF